MDRKISTLEYNNRTVYECFNNSFTDEFGIPDLNLHPVTFYYRPCPHKRSCHTPDLILYVISVASKFSLSTFTTPSDSSDLLPSDDPNALHVIKEYVPFLHRVKIGYCCRKHDQKRYYKNTRLYLSTLSDKKKKVSYFHKFSRINSDTSNFFL